MPRQDSDAELETQGASSSQPERCHVLDQRSFQGSITARHDPILEAQVGFEVVNVATLWNLQPDLLPVGGTVHPAAGQLALHSIPGVVSVMRTVRLVEVQAVL